MWHGRGQALVEFALVLPLLLLVILGAAQLGLALIVRLELAHAAIEGSRAIDCDAALAVVVEVYGRTPTRLGCRADERLLTVDAAVDVPLLIGVGHWRVAVTERSVR